MRRQYDCCFPDPVDLLDEFTERVFGGHIQADRRLIQEEDPGRMDHGRHQISLHPLPERHLSYRLVDDLPDSEDLIQIIQCPVKIRLVNLVDMFEKFKAFAKAEIPVEL